MNIFDEIWDTIEPYIEDIGINYRHAKKELYATLVSLCIIDEWNKIDCSGHDVCQKFSTEPDFGCEACGHYIPTDCFEDYGGRQPTLLIGGITENHIQYLKERICDAFGHNPVAIVVVSPPTHYSFDIEISRDAVAMAVAICGIAKVNSYVQCERCGKRLDIWDILDSEIKKVSNQIKQCDTYYEDHYTLEALKQ